MPRMVLRLDRGVKLQLRRTHRKTCDKGLAARCQIVLLRARGMKSQQVAEAVGLSISWVNRVMSRFIQQGMAGLMDRREDNGQTKVDEHYLTQLREVVGKSPQDYGHRRPTWTRELLVKVMHKLTGVKIHVGTMSRALRRIRARRGRPRPVVNCPWAKAAKARRIEAIERLVQSSASKPGHVVVYADEVDIHLNPKIGLDWMNRGQQKQVTTPGQNQKRYLAGAMDAHTRQLTWVEGRSKNSVLFVELLAALAARYSHAKTIHVVLDNYRIHHSKISAAAVASLGGRIVLHFLPPYCPQHNRIERLWHDVHANVTRNHTCATMTQLMQQVRAYLRRIDRAANITIRRAA